MPAPNPQRGGPGLGPVSRCRSCGAPIQWAYTPAGARMPIDHPEPDAGATNLAAWGHSTPTAPNVALVDGFAVVIGGLDAEHTPDLVPHWATCPDTVAWQGRSKAGTGPQPSDPCGAINPRRDGWCMRPSGHDGAHTWEPSSAFVSQPRRRWRR